MNLGEQRFAWLLTQRHIPFCTETNLEDCIQVRCRRPDFCAQPAEFPPILAEVKEFKKPGPLRKITARVWFAGPELFLRRLRGPVEAAAEQLEPYRADGIPMIVVLDNARRVGIPLGAIDLVQLLGAPEYVVPINVETGARPDPGHLHFGSGQVLTPNRRQYVSAVAVNLPKGGHQYVEPVEQERPMRLRILHNPYASVPLPSDVFSDPEDEHIGVRDGRWQNLRTGEPAWGR
ncbi:MAG: hypothetical protein V3T60_14595 [Candidatus Binatia bacterium]